MNTELFFSTDQLLSALRQRRFQERTVRLSRVEFSLRAVGGAPPGSFHDLRVIGDAAFYITGKVSPLSDNFETGCVASAALRYISSHLESTPPEEAIKKAATLFSLTTLRLHLFRENDGELSISDYHLTDDHGETIRPSIVQCDIAGELSRGAYVSDLDPTSTKRIDRYLGAFGGSEETSVQSRVLAGLLNPNRSKTKGTFVLFRSVGFTNR